jgi:hypothetical protein
MAPRTQLAVSPTSAHVMLGMWMATVLAGVGFIAYLAMGAI